MSAPPLVVLVPLLTTLLVLTGSIPAPAPRRVGVHDGSAGGSRRHDRVVAATRRLAALAALAAPLARRRRRRRIDEAFPDAVELLVLAVHAGATPAGAIRDVRAAVDPVLSTAFDAVVHRMERGHGLADAVTALVDHLGPRASGVADAIASTDRYGGPLGPVLDGLAREARDDRRRANEAHARTLSVKLSFPLVACTLPAFVLLAIVPAVLGVLTGLSISPVGP